MDKSENALNSEQNAENNFSSQANDKTSLESDAKLPDENNNLDSSTKFDKWNKLEQKLLFSLMYKHCPAWEKYSRCVLRKNEKEIKHFVRNSFSVVKNLNFVSTLRRIQKNPNISGKNYLIKSKCKKMCFTRFSTESN